MVTHESDQPGHRDWISLPEDILMLIASNLYMKDDIYRFRAVCKQWRGIEIPKRPCLKEDHIEFDSQYLVQKTRGDCALRLFHPVSDSGDPYPIHGAAPELHGASIVFSNEDWLLMSGGKSEIFFFNPLAKSLIRLPNLPEPCGFFIGYTFTTNPTFEDCLVFAVESLSPTSISSFTISCRENDDWKQSRTYDCGRLRPIYSSPLYFQGKFHILCEGGQLITFGKDRGRWKCVKPPEKMTSTDEQYVLEFDGNLIYLLVHRGGDISIHPWDEYRSNWSEEKLSDLGDYTIFLSRKTCFATKTARPCMKNKIFFPIFLGRYAIFFCLKHRCYRTFGSTANIQMCKTMLKLQCSWFELPIQYRNSNSQKNLNPSKFFDVALHWG